MVSFNASISLGQLKFHLASLRGSLASLVASLDIHKPLQINPWPAWQLKLPLAGGGGCCTRRQEFPSGQIRVYWRHSRLRNLTPEKMLRLDVTPGRCMEPLILLACYDVTPGKPIFQ